MISSYFRTFNTVVTTSKGEDERALLWDSAKILSDAFTEHEMRLPRVLDTIQQLQTVLEGTRLAYNLAIQERDAKRQLLVAAEGRLADVQRVVQRYAQVQEPVVASDGYTYERTTIQNYLDECDAADNQAYSQQTKEVLTDVLIPNQSLKKLVDLLKSVKPLDVPQATQRSPIPPLRGGAAANPANANAVSWGEEDDDENANMRKEERAIHASDLEAAVTAKRGVKDGGSDSSEQPSRSANQRQHSGSSNAAGNPKHRSHPCLRVYGFCNFKDDCSFAKYPYEACLNNIKGKCRFGSSCKELHVNPQDPKFLNQRATQQGAPSSARAHRPEPKKGE